MAKEDNIKFDYYNGQFWGVINEDIKRWKELYPCLDFDNINDLIKKANESIQRECYKRTGIGGYLSSLAAGPDPELKRRVYGEVMKNPRKALEKFLLGQYLSLSNALSDKQQEILVTGPQNPAGTGQDIAPTILQRI